MFPAGPRGCSPATRSRSCTEHVHCWILGAASAVSLNLRAWGSVLSGYFPRSCYRRRSRGCSNVKPQRFSSCNSCHGATATRLRPPLGSRARSIGRPCGARSWFQRCRGGCAARTCTYHRTLSEWRPWRCSFQAGRTGLGITRIANGPCAPVPSWWRV